MAPDSSSRRRASALMATPKCYNAFLSHRNMIKSILIYPGIAINELTETLRAAFAIDHEITGLQNSKSGVYFPISLLSKAPAYFSTSHESAMTYSIVTDEKKKRDESVNDESKDDGRKKDEKAGMHCEKDRTVEFDLSHLNLSDMLHVFLRASPTGTLDRFTFEKCFADIAQQHEWKNASKATFDRLFDMFDQDGNGMVDMAEFLSGLSVLSGGDRDDKIKAAFQLYDVDGDGFISRDEMRKYLSAVFSVIAETSNEVFHRHRVSPSDLADITTDQCFIEADLNDDGRLSFEEFRKWYTGNEPDAAAKKKSFQEREKTHLQSTNPLDMSEIQRIKTITGLADISVTQMFTIFSKPASNGELTRHEFMLCFRDIFKRKSILLTPKVAETLDSLFDIFDKDGNGTVDYVELVTGLSILCGGSQLERVSAAFSLFDTNGDGYISTDEMETYLGAVFRVLYETSESVRSSIDISPQQLAVVSTAEAFACADLDGDGRLSFEEFKKWYSGDFSNSISPPSKPNKDMDLSELKRLASLELYQPEEIFEIFADVADSEGFVSRASFDACVGKLMTDRSASGSPLTQEEVDRMQSLVDRIFDSLDVDGNGKLDFVELSSGLTVLCGGSQDEKVAAAFKLYDIDDNGTIERREMIAYLVSIFRVYLETHPAIQNELQASAEEIATATAEEAFQEAGKSDRLTFEDFKAWYSRFSLATGTKPLGSHPPSSSTAKAALTQPIQTDEDEFMFEDLREARLYTHLGSYDVNDVYHFFLASADEHQNLSKTKFIRCFNKLIDKNSRGGMDSEARKKTDETLNQLFQVFDSDGNGWVDTQELGCGITILCGGSAEARAQAAFDIVDENDDGQVSKAEMVKYLEAVLKVILHLPSASNAPMQGTPRALALAATTQCFLDYDKDEDSFLNFDEFSAWYSDPSRFHRLIAEAGKGPLTIAEARQLSGLEDHNVRDVFESFAQATDENGLISRLAFEACFRKLIRSSGRHYPPDRVNKLIELLFDLFDVNQDNVVDFAELASGLTVLAGGSQDEKVEAAFSLYDHDGNSVISLEEMTNYLTAVFKVIYTTDKTTRMSMNVSAQDLARITAQQAFHEANVARGGEMTLEQFRTWFKSSLTSPTLPNEMEHNKERHEDVKETSTLLEPSHLEEARRFTGLGSISVQEAFERFAKYADEGGCLSHSDFYACLNSIPASSNIPLDAAKKAQLMNRLWKTFDQDNNGYVDFTELSCGLSILCRGSRESKTKAAFDLYDVNRDGVISLDEMTNYLTNVFRVLYEIEGNLLTKTKVSAEELATISAQQAFVDADRDEDGVLTFQEFSSWYQQPTQLEKSDLSFKKGPEVEVFTLEEARRLTRLENYESTDVFELLAEFADESGFLSRKAFNECFYLLIAKSGNALLEAETSKIASVMDRLFNVFDSNGDGVIDFSEISSGLSILCGGSREDKVQAAFSIFDYNQDGYISRPELERYLTSVFRVLNETNFSTLKRFNVSPDELGILTAAQAMDEADLDGDDKLSFEEFKAWYTKSSNHTFKNESAKPPLPPWFTLQEVRRITKLNRLAPDTVFESLATSAQDDGSINRQAFKQCMMDFAHLDSTDSTEVTEGKEGKEGKDDEQDRLLFIIHRIFDIFVRSETGTDRVDFTELATGLSVLCGGSRNQKVKAAFSLYDYNQDGYISSEEMQRYLIAVFKVLYEATPETCESLGVTPEMLGRVTAEQAFVEADTNKDGRISYEEFEEWYLRPGNDEEKVEKPIDDFPAWLNLTVVRTITNLGQYSPEDAFQVLFSNSINGSLDRDAFFESFKEFTEGNSVSCDNTFEIVVGRLFAIFDTNHTGFVQLNDISSGISVLCGGGRADKVRAAFQLYDENHDGRITVDEMTHYLQAVFRLLYGVSHGLEKRLGVPWLELAQVTAAHCFQEADVEDGALHYEDFAKWYLRTGRKLDASMKGEEEELSAESSPSDLVQIRSILKLDFFSVSDVFEIFAEAAPTGQLDFVAYTRTFNNIISLAGGYTNELEEQVAGDLAKRLFQIYDTEGQNCVEFCELAIGLSVLCVSTLDEKLMAAFKLLDVNGEGLVGLEELELYMSCIFRIVFELSKHTYGDIKVTPQELGRITAQECLKALQITSSGKTTFDEFKNVSTPWRRLLLHQLLS